MAWTSKQRQIAVRACKAAGISEAQRIDMILFNMPNAEYGGDVTSTSPKLSNADFEYFMAVVERFAGGKVLHFTENYWQRQAEKSLQRMHYKVLAVAGALESAGKLEPRGVGLAGWIEKRVAGGLTNKLEDLAFPKLQALILQLLAYARQNAVKLAE